MARLHAMGFELEESLVFTPALAAHHLLTRAGSHRLHLAAPPALAEDLASFALVDDKPDAVIMGDLHTDFTWERLDRLFRMLLDGARLVALHRNRFCRRAGQLALDLGPFVAALEYAASTEALVVGKPSEAFFASAVADMGLERSEVIMVGDDILADIGGALAAGLGAVQLRRKVQPPRRDPFRRAGDRTAGLDRRAAGLAGRVGLDGTACPKPHLRLASSAAKSRTLMTSTCSLFG